MPIYVFHWTEEIVQHLAQHDVLPEEFEEVIRDPFSNWTTSRSTGRPARIGVTGDGRTLFCVFEWANASKTEVVPITAYEIE